MKSDINSILKEVLSKVNPPEEELRDIDKFLKKLISSIEKNLKRKKINAEIFVGGSFAKKTLIKKGLYDIDIFIRFSEENKGKDISKFAERAVSGIKKTGKISLIHGSRDYFKIEPDNKSFFVEIIPVMKIKNPKKAENITDLSYFHVNYIRKKLRTEKMLGEVRLAKAFCHANKSYGAESYINGFSGYAIELLVYYYRGFLNFVKAMAKIGSEQVQASSVKNAGRRDKEIIDIEKLYKNKNEILMDMNSAKMNSPIILIDPTYRERNAIAALSEETLGQFRKACKKFLKNPSLESFEEKKINLERIRKNAEKSKKEFILLRAETDKQEGDIAGSKLMKFYKHLKNEINKFYIISSDGFDYGGQKEAQYFFVVKSREKIILRGPYINDKKNVMLFKKKHKNTFIKNRKIYAKEKIEKNIKKFIKEWMNLNYEKMEDMHINELSLEN